MPTRVKIIHSADFLREKAEGVADLEWAEEVITEFVARSASLEGDYHLLVDTRAASGMLSASQLWYLAEKAAKHRRTFMHKTAILCPAERFDHAHFLAICADSKGCNVEAFTRYEDAMEWLLDDGPPDASAP